MPPIGGSLTLQTGYHPSSRTHASSVRRRAGPSSIWSTIAPYAAMKSFMVHGTRPKVKTTAGRPAFAAWAAVAAPWLPVEESSTTGAPTPRACATATAASRSLKDQVGLRVSSLAYSRATP